MSLNLQQFYKQYGVRPLAAATAEFIPGAILKDSGSSRYRPLGQLKDVLAGLTWDTLFEDANLPQGSIEEEKKGGANISVLGIKLGGDASQASKVKVTVTRPTVQRFKDLPTLKLTAALKKLKADDRPTYSTIDENWVMTHAWFAQELTLEFTNAAGARLDLSIDRIDVKLGAGANLSKNASGNLVITQNQNIPFGFWGFKI